RLGIEMSARTLLALKEEDPEWVKGLRGLAERGLVEPIASGWAQVVGPLTPVEVNRANLELGNEIYHDVLGFVPETFFVPEQTFADGLTPLFEEAGARSLVMEWNNPAASQPALRPLRCQPARLRSPSGKGPRVLWNDSIVFQKVQRVAQGSTPASDLESLMDRLSARPGAEALCLYGGDVEIFDYRPSRPIPELSGGEGEMDRLISLLRRFAGDPRFEMVLPREVTADLDLLPEVSLASATDPIPCKKQPRYNPTRWVVSGRNGFGMNTRCHGLLRSEAAARRLVPSSCGREESRALVDLWRSDFRTRATEEKIVEFETGIGVAMERSRRSLERATPRLEEGEDLLIVNPGDSDWEGMPVEIPLKLPTGRYPHFALRSRRGEPLGVDAQQVEVRGRHRDGSVRDAVLVLEPRIPAGEVAAFQLVAARADEAGADTIWTSEGQAETGSVRASLLRHRGAALSELAFPRISEQPLLGTIPHGSFDEIAYTPDFYSGHVVAITETGDKHADLRDVSAGLRLLHSGPVRIALAAELETPFGTWRKILHLYRSHSRMDLIHDLAFHEARLASLRLGLFTFLPDSFDRETLRYGAVHGGTAPEWHAFEPGASIAQSAAVSASVSATSCLGATEGWVAVEDAEKGVLVERRLAEAAVAPLLDFAEVDDRFFCRLSHTAAETDETRATFVRGRRRFSFSVQAYRRRDGAPTREAALRDQGLVYRTESGVGVTSQG
ncbi:MAG: hypothetical protein ACX98W_17025, partial [bacterium]